MGELIELAAHRASRRPGAVGSHGSHAAVFHFDLACPFSYLALERVELRLPGVRWEPTFAAGMPRGAGVSEAGWAAAERRARELRLPLMGRPEPEAARGAMRAAAWAAERGRGGAFALAAGRLAFGGGFDLSDPELLAEAAAAAGISVGECMAAASVPRMDEAPTDAAARLCAAGATRLPVLRAGLLVHCGEREVAQALTTLGMAAASG